MFLLILNMLRAEAISIMVKTVEQSAVFYNLQPHGLIVPRSLHEEMFTLTSAMGLGGGTNACNSKGI